MMAKLYDNLYRVRISCQTISFHAIIKTYQGQENQCPLLVADYVNWQSEMIGEYCTANPFVSQRPILLLQFVLTFSVVIYTCSIELGTFRACFVQSRINKIVPRSQRAGLERVWFDPNPIVGINARLAAPLLHRFRQLTSFAQTLRSRTLYPLASRFHLVCRTYQLFYKKRISLPF